MGVTPESAAWDFPAKRLAASPSATLSQHFRIISSEFSQAADFSPGVRLSLIPPKIPPLSTHARRNLSALLQQPPKSRMQRAFARSMSTDSQMSSANGNGLGYKRASRKGAPRKFMCEHPGCDKIYSRAEHLQRHQLNRKTLAPQTMHGGGHACFSSPCSARPPQHSKG